MKKNVKTSISKDVEIIGFASCRERIYAASTLLVKTYIDVVRMLLNAYNERRNDVKLPREIINKLNRILRLIEKCVE